MTPGTLTQAWQADERNKIQIRTNQCFKTDKVKNKPTACDFGGEI